MTQNGVKTKVNPKVARIGVKDDHVYYCPKCEDELHPISQTGSHFWYHCEVCELDLHINEDVPEFPFGEFDNGLHWQGEF
jgi:hypothetical protein